MPAADATGVLSGPAPAADVSIPPTISEVPSSIPETPPMVAPQLQAVPPAEGEGEGVVGWGVAWGRLLTADLGVVGWLQRLKRTQPRGWQLALALLLLLLVVFACISWAIVGYHSFVPLSFKPDVCTNVSEILVANNLDGICPFSQSQNRFCESTRNYFASSDTKAERVALWQTAELYQNRSRRPERYDAFMSFGYVMAGVTTLVQCGFFVDPMLANLGALQVFVGLGSYIFHFLGDQLTYVLYYFPLVLLMMYLTTGMAERVVAIGVRVPGNVTLVYSATAAYYWIIFATCIMYYLYSTAPRQKTPTDSDGDFNVTVQVSLTTIVMAAMMAVTLFIARVVWHKRPGLKHLRGWKVALLPLAAFYYGVAYAMRQPEIYLFNKDPRCPDGAFLMNGIWSMLSAACFYYISVFLMVFREGRLPDQVLEEDEGAEDPAAAEAFRQLPPAPELRWALWIFPFAISGTEAAKAHLHPAAPATAEVAVSASSSRRSSKAEVGVALPSIADSLAMALQNDMGPPAVLRRHGSVTKSYDLDSGVTSKRRTLEYRRSIVSLAESDNMVVSTV